MSRKTIKWDELENRYIDDEGNLYAPNDINMTTPSTTSRKFKVRTPSNPRDFFILDVYPFKFDKKRKPDTLEMGYAIVKPYHHDANLRVRYELQKWDTRQSYNDKIRKEIQRVLSY